MTKADQIFRGRIYPHAGREETVGAIAIAGDRILCVGSWAEVSGCADDRTEIRILGKEEIITPSYAEGHAHVSSNTEIVCDVLLYGLRSVREYQDAITRFRDAHPDCVFLRGSGWINGVFPNGTPTADLLDEIVPDIPVVLVSEDHHSHWVNTKALELAGIGPATDPTPGGVIEKYPGTDRPCGCFREKSMDLIQAVIPPYTPEEFKYAILDYQKKALSFGVTAVFEPIYLFPHEALAAYRALESEGALCMRFSLAMSLHANLDADLFFRDIAAEKAATDGEHLSLSTVKFFIDGVVEGHTAFLLDDYQDTPGNRGENLWKQEKLNDAVARCEEYGYNIHVHAIGDAAVRSILDAFEYSREVNGPRPGLRHAITHLQVVAAEDMVRMGRLGILGVVNPYWHFNNPVYHEVLEIPYLGQERADAEYPMRSLSEAGVKLVVASDFPVTMIPEIFMAVRLGVTRTHPLFPDVPPLGKDETRTVAEMMEALTNGFYQQHLESDCGTLTVGARADFVILDRDIYQVSPEKIADTNVLATYLLGQLVYED